MVKQLHCPALLVAAPASSSGKTTVVAALARLHSRQGRRVRVFKCGPDFLDPQIHEIASGAPCENIDLAMCSEADLRWLLARAERNADLILIEGVMGIYDSEPSTVELARRLGVPILLVVDAQAMTGSFGAVSWRLKHYREGAPISAAFANRIGSAYHAELCRSSLPNEITWMGALQRDTGIMLPERHLGLLPANEIADNFAIADALQRHVGEGKPMLAECGGMIACFEHLFTIDGKRFNAFGILPGESRMQRRLTGLGLHSVELPEGHLSGHSFHDSTITTPLTPITYAHKLSGGGGEPIYRHRRLTGSYMHICFPSNPQASARIFLP